MFCAQACRLQVMLHEEIAKGAIASVWPGRGAWSGTGVVTYVKSAMLRSLAGDASALAGGNIFEVLSGRRAARLPVVNILQRTSWVSSDRSQVTVCASCL